MDRVRPDNLDAACTTLVSRETMWKSLYDDLYGDR